MGSNNPDNNTPIAGALTYPGRSADSLQSLPVQPRQPRNLQGLLRFAMEATKAEDAPGNSELGPMDEERRKFLEDALKSLTVNVAQVLQESIKILSDSQRMRSIQLGETIPDDVKFAFLNLMEYIDDIDVANDFYKMGGFAIFPIAYSSENEEVRSLASSVLGEVCQNNPHCQLRALECGLLGILLTYLDTEQGAALAKCLYAISCCTRDFEPSCRELTSRGGCATLARLLGDCDSTVRTKAAFLVTHLCRHYPDAKEEFIQNNLVKIIAEQIKGGRDWSSEHLLSTLLSLVEGLDPTVLRQCRDPKIGLKHTLETHLKHPDLDADTFVEEKEYCQEILRQVFENYTHVDVVEEETADR